MTLRGRESQRCGWRPKYIASSVPTERCWSTLFHKEMSFWGAWLSFYNAFARRSAWTGLAPDDALVAVLVTLAAALFGLRWALRRAVRLREPPAEKLPGETDT